MSAPRRTDPAWVRDLRQRVIAHLHATSATQIGLAEYLGVSPKHVNQILKGVIAGTPSMLDQMAAAAGLEIVVRESGRPAPVLAGRRCRGASARDEQARRQEIAQAILAGKKPCPLHGGTSGVCAGCPECERNWALQQAAAVAAGVTWDELRRGSEDVPQPAPARLE